jgi:hypothetical protein
MNKIRISTLFVTATLALASGGLAASASSNPSHRPAPTPAVSSRAVSTPANTPDRCIRLNAGDYNACNVGNNGRGDLPYRSHPDHRRLTRGGARP